MSFASHGSMSSSSMDGASDLLGTPTRPLASRPQSPAPRAAVPTARSRRAPTTSRANAPIFSFPKVRALLSRVTAAHRAAAEPPTAGRRPHEQARGRRRRRGRRRPARRHAWCLTAPRSPAALRRALNRGRPDAQGLGPSCAASAALDAGTLDEAEVREAIKRIAAHALASADV